MNRVVRRVRRAVANALNLDMMSEPYHVLVKNYVLLVAYTTLESTFVNTLLYTVLPDITIVIFYRAIVYFSTALLFHPAAYLGQKKTPTLVIRWGALLYMGAYLLLFFGLDHMKQVMVFSAVFSGAGAAFYWSGHTSLVPHYTTPGNRDVGIAILGIVQGITTLMVPMLSGFVIRWMPGTTGYRVMFGLGMLAAAAQLLVQRHLAPAVQKRHQSQAKLAFLLLRKKRSYQLMVGYEVLRGFRDGAFAFILNMLLFEIVTDEALVGINTFLTGAASILGSWVFGKVVRPHMRAQITIGVSLILTLCCLPLFAVLNVATVMGFTLASSFFTLFIANSCSNTTYDVMCQNATARRCMGETAAIREGALAVGRLGGLALLLGFPHNQRGYVTSILILTASQLLCGFLMLLTQRTLQKKRRQGPAAPLPAGEALP